MSNAIGLITVTFIICATIVLTSWLNYRKAVEVEEIRRAEYRDALTALVNSYTETHTEKD